MARWAQRTAWFANQDKDLTKMSQGKTFAHWSTTFWATMRWKKFYQHLHRDKLSSSSYSLGISISSPRSKLLFSNIEFKKKHTYSGYIGLFYLCFSNSSPAEHEEGILWRQHRREEQWQLGAIQSKEGHLQEVSSPSMSPSPVLGSAQQPLTDSLAVNNVT